MNLRQFISSILLLALTSTTANAQFSFDSYALQNVNIIDVNTNNILYDYTIVVTKNKIYDILPSKKYKANDTIQSFILKEKFVVPGLIDAHVHFATDPTEERRDNAEKILKEMLLTGITSVRDMAGDSRALSSLSRNALVGDIVAPNIYYSSLMAGTKFFSDKRTIATAQGGVSGKMPYMKAIDDNSNIELEVAQAKGTGAQGIKLYASLTKEQVRKIVAEAKKQAIPVWSHGSLIPALPSEVITSGVISISHSVMLIDEKYQKREDIPANWKGASAKEMSAEFWDKEYSKLELDILFKLMKQHDVVLDATLSVYEQYKNSENGHWRFEMAKRITRDANKMGIKVAAGSDSDQATFIQHEMKLLINESGFTPFQAIISATKHSAQASGILDTEGTIELGKKANFLFLNSNPIENINNIDDIFLVIKNGKLYNKK
ncbi:amidohydrolase family protein [Flavobacterium granuli]|uniref:Imidazolonepropionase-like amidohydrolase n=1 Tax=Flavobacterium granuli TaxID=280093 RepID=A0ABU1RXF2_9FLAO|nr:amidohydrolase family protein [Flavobacterium granuli]MDR6843446.1 imidazolonepropionase-like amidohydrolase [Flavobacterium granuli]